MTTWAQRGINLATTQAPIQTLELEFQAALNVQTFWILASSWAYDAKGKNACMCVCALLVGSSGRIPTAWPLLDPIRGILQGGGGC